MEAGRTGPYVRKEQRMTIRKMVAMAALAGVMGLMLASAPSASANYPGDDISIVSAQASSSVKVSIKYNYIGTWVMATQPLKRMANGRPKCYWASGTWTNSVKIPVVRPYQETSRAKFCALKKPVTANGVRYTHVKVAGGKTGSPCKNLAIPPGRPQPKPQIKGPVLDVRSLASVEIPVKVNSSASASVTGQRQCPGGALSGSASGKAGINGTVRIRVSLAMIMKNKGRTDGAVRRFIEQQIRVKVEGSAKSDAQANIVIVCGAAPPGQPPPQQPPPKENPKPAPACRPIAHLQYGADAFVWCEVVVPAGATLSGERMRKVSGPSDTRIDAPIPVDVRWDNTPCPSGTRCYRARVWAGRTDGDFVYEFEIFANFATGPTTTGTVQGSIRIEKGPDW